MTFHTGLWDLKAKKKRGGGGIKLQKGASSHLGRGPRLPDILEPSERGELLSDSCWAHAPRSRLKGPLNQMETWRLRGAVFAQGHPAQQHCSSLQPLRLNALFDVLFFRDISVTFTYP